MSKEDSRGNDRGADSSHRGGFGGHHRDYKLDSRCHGKPWKYFEQCMNVCSCFTYKNNRNAKKPGAHQQVLNERTGAPYPAATERSELPVHSLVDCSQARVLMEARHESTDCLMPRSKTISGDIKQTRVAWGREGGDRP